MSALDALNGNCNMTQIFDSFSIRGCFDKSWEFMPEWLFGDGGVAGECFEPGVECE